MKKHNIKSVFTKEKQEYTEDIVQAALEEIRNGQSVKGVSRKHNIPAKTLQRWMKRLNIKSAFSRGRQVRDQGHKQYTEDSLHTALEEIRDGQSVCSVGRKHNIPDSTLYDQMKQHNIKSVLTKKKQEYTEDSVQAALEEIRNGQRVQSVSRKHNIPASTLNVRVKQHNIKSVFTKENQEHTEDSVQAALEEIRNSQRVQSCKV